MNRMLRKLCCGVTLAGALLAFAGCATQKLSDEGIKLINQGQLEQGLALLARASELEPTNSQLRVDYLKYQLAAVRDLLRRADDARAAGQPAVARDLYETTLRLDPSNYRAKRGLEALATDAQHRALVAEATKLMNAGDLAGARAKLRQVLLENPSQADAQRLLAQVNERIERAEETARQRTAAASVMKKPVTLQFREANVRMVFEALSRTTGLNVIFDRDVRADLKTTIFVKDASVGDTVDLILLQNQLDKKVLNANTMLIYPATAAKQKEFQDLKVRTFQISNGDAKHLQTVLKTVLKIKDIALDERTNTLVIRDTSDAVAVAEKVVAAYDFPDAEVMLEVEVLEVARDKLLDLGIKWPEGFTVATPTTANTIGALQALTYKDLLITPLAVGFNFKLDEGAVNLLASPRIRTRNKEKARIMIGDKVPVITNTTTPLSTGAAVVTGSVQYLDVGIKLEVEPQIYAEGDVGIKLNLDVSNIVKEIPGPQGSLAYQIGTRSAQTNLRLRDGETQILGGLISELDRKTASKIPGVGQLPVVGKLFSTSYSNNTKTEIVLSITPRIVRAVTIADAGLRDIYSGTEASMRAAPLRLDPVGAAGGAPITVSSAAVVSTFAAQQGPTQQTPMAQASPGAPVVASNRSPRPPSSQAVPGTSTPASPEATGAAAPEGGAQEKAPAEPSASPQTVSSQSEPAAAAATAALASAASAATQAVGTAAPALAAGELSLKGPSTARVGQQLDLQVDASVAGETSTLPLLVRFDPKVLSFVEATPANAERSGGVARVTQKVDPVTGRVEVELKAEGKPFSGDERLLNLRFVATSVRTQTTIAVGYANSPETAEGRPVPRVGSLRLRVQP